MTIFEVLIYLILRSMSAVYSTLVCAIVIYWKYHYLNTSEVISLFQLDISTILPYIITFVT